MHFLSVMMLLCCPLTASADSVTPKIVFAGHLVIYAFNNGEGSSLNTSGHAFLSFKNTSSSPVMLGPINVQPGQEITFGTWGNRNAHRGIWYNLESYLANHKNDLKGRVSLITGVTGNDLATINSVIKNNDTWSATNNCSTFAVKVWNSICSDNLKLNAGIPNTPTTLMSSIKLKSNYESDRSIQDATPVGYLNDDGGFVEVRMTTETLTDTLRNLDAGVCRFDESVTFVGSVNVGARNWEGVAA